MEITRFGNTGGFLQISKILLILHPISQIRDNLLLTESSPKPRSFAFYQDKVSTMRISQGHV